MSKVALGPQTLVYPMPVVLVGANVDGKPNFMAVAWCSTVGSMPPKIAISIRHTRHTYKGIQQNRAFSVNLPSVSMIRETDYCGITHGNETDKVAACGFKLFAGKLAGAPLIEQCPVAIECSLAHELDLGVHALIVGKIEETYVSEECLTEGRPDITKIAPLVYLGPSGARYHALGAVLGKAFSVGQALGKGPGS